VIARYVLVRESGGVEGGGVVTLGASMARLASITAAVAGRRISS
jgi:hypothetical protein